VELARGDRHLLPLFFAPGLVGHGLDFVHLAEALDSGIPLYALQARGLKNDEEPDECLRDAARQYVDRILATQPRGPYGVAGFSAGGVVALAIAEELHRRGRKTDFVGLIDSVPPFTVPIPSPFSSPRRLQRLLQTAAGRVREVARTPNPLSSFWRRTRSAIVRVTAGWSPVRLVKEPKLEDIFVGADTAFSENDGAFIRRQFQTIMGHPVERLPIDLVLFRTRLDPFEGPHEPKLGWNRATAGTVRVEIVEGLHHELLSTKGVDAVAVRLEPFLRSRVARRH
jgi:acetoacetyl-CoA synthetase